MASEEHVHPLLSRWRRGEVTEFDAHLLLTHGELPVTIVRVEAPGGLPSPPLAWVSLAFDLPGPRFAPYAGLAPGLPHATSDQRLPAGRHILTVDAPGFLPARVPIDVPEDGETEARVELIRAPRESR